VARRSLNAARKQAAFEDHPNKLMGVERAQGGLKGELKTRGLTHLSFYPEGNHAFSAIRN
jgi:hypothetical protein